MLAIQTKPEQVTVPLEVTAPFTEQAPVIDPHREAGLRQVLDGPTGGVQANYESAVRLGVVDIFHYDPSTGQDGILHTLSGEVLKGIDGAVVPEGFHHEPSGAFIAAESPSIVDRTHLEGLNARKRSNFAERPFEPYQAKVVVAGHKKFTPQTDPATGKQTIKEARNFMFPKEYDALSVLQAVRMAYQGRNREEDRVANNGKIVAEGFATMIDGESLMQIRMILDPNSEKIIAAYPMIKFRGIMKLSEEAVRRLEEGEELEQAG